MSIFTKGKSPVLLVLLPFFVQPLRERQREVYPLPNSMSRLFLNYFVKKELHHIQIQPSLDTMYSYSLGGLK
ncbi:MAG: hypothetical protein FWB96_05700, partial [Defluviitaleaceae bacterium]|nr:hypothetical protein [Defluviitaleaceae bacterium]MCL2264372.1 hypothetical protein [Defluviitaleaceae bacterium]